mmetsp:Transcript_61350/g.164774  ORF Transcript_61350/g.164774 Transcript_61350/m.164774 type:complete len:346 (+) Transcript_61350:727-1764(+)
MVLVMAAAASGAVASQMSSVSPFSERERTERPINRESQVARLSKSVIIFSTTSTGAGTKTRTNTLARRSECLTHTDTRACSSSVAGTLPPRSTGFATPCFGESAGDDAVEDVLLDCCRVGGGRNSQSGSASGSTGKALRSAHLACATRANALSSSNSEISGAAPRISTLNKDQPRPPLLVPSEALAGAPEDDALGATLSLPTTSPPRRTAATNIRPRAVSYLCCCWAVAGRTSGKATYRNDSGILVPEIECDLPVEEGTIGRRRAHTLIYALRIWRWLWPASSRAVAETSTSTNGPNDRVHWARITIRSPTVDGLRNDTPSTNTVTSSTPEAPPSTRPVTAAARR